MFGRILVCSALADKGGAGWGKRGRGEGGKREKGAGGNGVSSALADKGGALADKGKGRVGQTADA